MEIYSINMNYHVYVELSDRGWQSIRDHYNSVFQGRLDVEPYIERLKRYTKEYVVGGEKKMLTEFQIHDFIHTFGGCYGNFVNDGREPFAKGLKLYFDLEQMEKEE